jgi:hypothetical protein
MNPVIMTKKFIVDLSLLNLNSAELNFL